jgi:hypothetical protein
MAATGVGEQAVAENQLSQALFNLRAVAEAYPDPRRTRTSRGSSRT